MDACVAAEVARGLLPPGRLGDPVIAALRPEVEEIAGHALRVGAGEPRSVDVKVPLEDGRILTGTVPGVHGDLLRAVTFSRVSARHRMASWVRFLALSAALPDRPVQAVLIGRARRGSDGRVTCSRFAPVGAEGARERLAVLLDLHRAGLREPLPLSCLAGAAFATSGENAARREWESSWSFPREDADLEHQLVFGEVLPFDAMLEREGGRFAELARRLWEPMLADEELADG
jgi:exodeoxyribonuclease V gamma subunit